MAYSANEMLCRSKPKTSICLIVSGRPLQLEQLWYGPSVSCLFRHAVCFGVLCWFI